jgi:CubicO group peptidase (beta-lactamase class C family)
MSRSSRALVDSEPANGGEVGMKTSQIPRRGIRGVAVAVLFVLAACDGGAEAPEADQPAATASGTEANAEEVATGFLEAFGAFDVDGAIGYLAEDAEIAELIGSVGSNAVGTLDELRLLVDYLEAAGYRQELGVCEETGTSTSGTGVRCPFEFHLFGSDQLGLGPYAAGSTFDLTVEDGLIVTASQDYGTVEFSPQMWEPFADWVSTTHPEDVAVMYTDGSQSGVRLSEESIRLWRRYVREYVEDHTYALGEFPPFPDEPLPGSTTEALQAALDATIEDGTFIGVTAAVIVADRGSWAGAAGSADGIQLTPDSPSPTQSSSKTVVAAQVLRLAEEGLLSLDDLASEYLPPELRFFDANGATIRQVLGMRSGIPGLNEFTPEGGYAVAEQASTAVKAFRKLPASNVAPGGEPNYAGTNYVLLGAIIEHVTGRPLSETLRSDVLDRPGLEGVVYTVEDALAADGYGVRATPGALARWGYELYGGFVLSAASLREMTDFQGDWYGLGVMDLSGGYGTLAVGHEGESSVTTCCSVIRLVALPEEGVVITVQANTAATTHPYDTYNSDVVRLTQVLRDAVQG